MDNLLVLKFELLIPELKQLKRSFIPAVISLVNATLSLVCVGIC